MNDIAAVAEETTEAVHSAAFITNDAVVLGLLMITLAAIFYTSSLKSWKKFYSVVPALLLCYFIPSLYNTFGLIDGEKSQLYFVATRYLLPTSLVLLTLSIDLKGILKLGPKALIMFLTATVGIVIGGPIALMIFKAVAPSMLGEGEDALWRGMATISGSWIGGGANQAAMLEIFKPSGSLYSIMIAVDVIVANIWMAFLLLGAGMYKQVDKAFNADSSAIEDLKKRVEDYRASILKLPTLSDTMKVLGVGFVVTAIGHFFADIIATNIQEYITVTKAEVVTIYGTLEAAEASGDLSTVMLLERASLGSSFFWLIVIATTLGLALSFTRVRKLEGVGASRLGSVMIYVLVATIGMHMDVEAIKDYWEFFLLGIIWMLVHVTLLLIVAKIIRAPFFFVAVGSQANVGGAASAPVVASAFSPALAPVGVLLAVFGYFLGTYAAYGCALLMQWVSQ
ncbi:DUF819 domain-containing protein [Roseivirga sp. BDSF3-8]|uniref:DUF819 family protein n=1 Tax=Roseivirga sp. BDSF3-8 TaxID=3241598 RepID=UPI0035325A7E